MASRASLLIVLCHQFCIASGNLHSIDFRQNALARNFPHILHSALIQRSRIGVHNALADGVCGIALGQRCAFQELFFQNALCRHFLADDKISFCKRARFIKHHHFRMGQRL